MSGWIRAAALAVTVGASAAASGALALSPGALPPPADRALARAVLAELVGIDSTHARGSTEAARAVAARALAAGFAPGDVTVVAPPDRPQSASTVVRLRGRGRGKPLLFVGHLDVVDVDAKGWSTPPFTLTERDGYLYGRGTEDMKGDDALLLAALIRLKREGFVPDRDVVVAFTEGEEAGSAVDGVQWLFAHRRDLVDSDLVLNVDDSGPRLRGGRRVYIGVETSEKLYATYELETTNPGGHSSLPRPDNAIYQMTAALQRLAAWRFPVRTTATTRAYFASLARLRTGQEAADLVAVAREGPDPQAAERLSRDPERNALLRTTCVATVLNAGTAESLLPSHAHATVQCRLMPGETPEQTLATLRTVVADPGVKITVDEPIDPSPETAATPDILARYAHAAGRVWPGVPVVPEMAAGASDSVYARLAGVPSYLSSAIFIEDSRAHGQDERVLAQAFDEGGQYDYELIKVMSAR